MSEPNRASHPKGRLSCADVVGFDALAELALDMRSSWNHATDEVWERLDPELWSLTQNPWVVLQTASRAHLERVLADPVFFKHLDQLVCLRRDDADAPAWFQQAYPQAPLRCVAYFSMEFMLSEALPIYSGGLGNVAGDQLKAASDLGVPVVGVGLLYQRGYFRQLIDHAGAQRAVFPYNDPGQLPITPVRHPSGGWLRLELELPGHSIWLRAWEVRVGRTVLYLLDSNDPANYPPYRGITGELYGGGSDVRLMQELVLGIGGWQLLATLGLEPDVCHLNEGHAALAVLERARSFMQASGQPFAAALAATRAGNLFTTHTAVAAGFDRFSPAHVEQRLGDYARTQLGIELDELLALGRRDPSDASEPFNMAYLAIRGSGAVNGVSRLHGEVSRELFGPLFERWPSHEVPVGHVTNGVHMPTWDSAAADELWTEACGKDRWLGATEALGRDIRRVSDERLWRLRTRTTVALVEYARTRLSKQLAASRASPEEVEAARRLFDPAALTLGFARRFASYKRPNLLLHDPARLLRILSDPQRPVQLIMAGKAHPADRAGQDLILEWTRFIRRPEVRPHVMFLGDHDMILTEHLVQGVDVWLNTPRRPWEASGTSGMKVLVNGGINLSELDGWWAEAHAPDVGWTIGDGQDRGEDPAWDAAEAEALYDLLEHEVIPAFYTRDERGIPRAWVERMRESMAQLTPRFSSNRAVREYTEQYYLPAAAAVHERTAAAGETGAKLVEWRQALARSWAALRFGAVSVETDGERYAFEVHVFLGELEPEAVRVELYADGIAGGAPERHPMARVGPRAGASGDHIYRGAVTTARPAQHYTARVIPCFEGAAVPLEEARILWQA